MKLADSLRLPQTATLALTGAGGKTTWLFGLARDFPAALVTTSTHLGAWQVKSADRHWIWDADKPTSAFQEQPGPGITLVTGPLSGERYVGPTKPQLDALRGLAARNGLPLLIEADGARQKALKSPGPQEPAIPAFVDAVAVVAGLSALGGPLTNQTVHRAEIFASLVGAQLGDTITPEMIARELVHPEGGLKGIPAAAGRVAMLHQADSPDLQARASAIAPALLVAYEAVVIAGRPPNLPSDDRPAVTAVYESVAGVILAAGGASRYGRPKQLLAYQGQTFMQRVAQTALAAGLSPVIVVTGAHAEAVEAELADLPVVVIRNSQWASGQASSIRAGVGALPGRTGGAVFLLADQPQVTPHVIRALVEQHALKRPAIVAPLAADRRANPVLFDRSTFGELLGLQGDVGGRAIFSKFRVDYLPWHDESLLLDVDTEADYRRLLGWGLEE